jgi:hypothetical protein
MAAQAKASDTQAYAEKKENRLAIYGQLAQIDIMKAKALMDMNMPKRR